MAFKTLRALQTVSLAAAIPAACLGEASNPYNPHVREEVSYSEYFSPETIAQAAKYAARKNLDPMLDIGVSVPNGGIHRFFPHEGWKKGNIPRLVSVFAESPYRETAPILYWRPDWSNLEKSKDEWLFDLCLEPLFERAVREHARLCLALACNCGSSSVAQKHEGRALAVPKYLFEELAKTDHPMKPDSQFGAAWMPDYESPLLLERHRALLAAFSRWIEGNVKGTALRRKDVLFAVEMRYLGYWGEGGVPAKYLPRSDMLDRYARSYVEFLPDTLLIAAGQETLCLPRWSAWQANPSNDLYIAQMRHARVLFSGRNNKGPFGFFIDSWHPYSDQYDIHSSRVMFDEKGNVQSLALAFRDEVYGRRYLTGEFGFLYALGRPELEPYATLYQQFTTRGMAGMSIHNFSAIPPRKPQHGNGRPPDAPPKPVGLPESVYANGRNCISMLGYRIVLGSPRVSRTPEKTGVSFTLANIGVARCFCDWWRLHLKMVAGDGSVLEDQVLPFDVRSLAPAAKPLLWREEEGARIEAALRPGGGKVLLSIEDVKGIEYPMTLSNWGRRPDGSYLLD